MRVGVIHEKEDIYCFTFGELREIVRTIILDYKIISKRKDEYKLYEKLTSSRVITSDGDILVTTFTDPGWTPLLVSVKGRVTREILIGQSISHEEMIELINQEIMEMLFPNIEQLPVGSMTLSIARGEDGEDKVAFLVLGNEILLQDILEAPKSVNVNTKVDVHPEKNENGTDTDVVISFQMYYPTGTPKFETVISGGEKEVQQHICQTLMEAKSLYVFFATDGFKFARLMEFGWTPTAHPLISRIAGGGL